MELTTAIKLIAQGVPAIKNAQQWADLGAGAGLFTRALGGLLHSGSTIYALDKNKMAVASIAWPYDDIIFRVVLADLEGPWQLPLLDGLIIANALHYIKNKVGFLKDMRSKVNPNGRIIVVEYERTFANQWVPYPIAYAGLTETINQAGFRSITKLGEEPSKFRQGNLYAALILN